MAKDKRLCPEDLERGSPENNATSFSMWMNREMLEKVTFEVFSKSKVIIPKTKKDIRTEGGRKLSCDCLYELHLLLNNSNVFSEF